MPLAEHYRKKVPSVPENTSVEQIAAILERDRAGCVVVLGMDGSATGIVTDRDLALRVVASGRDPERTTAVAIMSHPVVTVAGTDALEHAIEQMARHSIRRVLVTDGSAPVGIVSLDDLLPELGSELKDLGDLSHPKGRKARRAAGLPQLREEMDRRLQDFRVRLEHAGEKTSHTLLREFDSLRDRLRRMLD
jgi:CBS domain-containing protein